MSVAGRRAGSAASLPEGDDKAFWISFADLMTALMVMFLMVMAVSLLAITRASKQSAANARTPVAAAASQPAEARVAALPASAPASGGAPPDPAIALLEARLAQVASQLEGVHYDAERHVIDFGERARFASGSHRLDADSARLLRQFVPSLLAITETEQGKRWIQRVVVEGFADTRGDYLFNLNLSLQRAQRVMCTLMDVDDESSALSPEMRGQARDIFSVGGFSFNDQRDSLEASRRIELRIEFGPRPVRNSIPPATGLCRLPA